MSTRALEAELQAFLTQAPLPDGLEEREANRAARVARELARRDYRFRPHGKVCCCEDCCDLYDTWQWMARRSDPEITREGLDVW